MFHRLYHSIVWVKGNSEMQPPWTHEHHIGLGIGAPARPMYLPYFFRSTLVHDFEYTRF
jgi:hypothetical protein